MENFRSTEEALLVTNYFLAYCCSLFVVLLPFKTDFNRPIFNYDFSVFGINPEKVTFVCVCVCKIQRRQNCQLPRKKAEH